MKVPEPEDEQPIAWTAILQNEAVLASDGQQIGIVSDVLGAEDIFHGILVRTGVDDHDVMVQASDVHAITTRAVQVALTPDEVRALPPFEPEGSFRLGITGLFGRALGWVHDDGREPPGNP
jgi:hypothetical protein